MVVGKSGQQGMRSSRREDQMTAFRISAKANLGFTEVKALSAGRSQNKTPSECRFHVKK
jgi:hypothetical protein